MFLSRIFKRRKGVVERIEAYTKPKNTTTVRYRRRCAECGTGIYSPCFDVAQRWADEHRCREHAINVALPATVDGALLATQIERQLRRRGLN